MSRNKILLSALVSLAACGGESMPVPDLGGDHSVAKDLAREQTAVDQSRPDQLAPDTCTPKAWYADQDSDGYGDPKTSKQACAQPTGYVADQTDCDDSAKEIHPGAAELCNTVDDDCNGKVDDLARGNLTFCKDGDGDGYGDPKATVQGCAPPPGYVTDCTDCSDADPALSPKAADAPDPSGIDSNCDGVDGALGQAILVSATSGDDTKDGKGSFAAGVLTVAPVKTVAKGIELAAACAPSLCYVLIAEGTYDAGASPLAIAAGVNLHGGYQDLTWERTLTRDKVVLTSTASPAVKADAVALATLLDRLTVRGPDLSSLATAGVESVAMIVSNTATSVLTLRDVQLEAGKGSPGIAGSNGATRTCTCTGGAGSPVENGCWTIPTSEVPGSPGLCGSLAGGGKVGAYSCQNLCGGGPGVGIPATNGAPGSPGGNGANGGSGAAGTAGSPPDGSFTGSDWVPSSSTAGGEGVNGGGGGGGGGGGHYRWWCDVFLNASTIELNGGLGGKGGDGGCGGSAGTSGGAGGAAIGLLLVSSTLTFDGVAIKLGAGGAGGNGGVGGPGQGFTPGAAGGAAATGGSWYGLCPPYGLPLCPYYPKESGAGGKGGDGGFGGGGGGGGGGNGGPTYGLVITGPLLPASLPTYDVATASGGAKGLGGTGGKAGDNVTTGGKGADGAIGVVEKCLADGKKC